MLRHQKIKRKAKKMRFSKFNNPAKKRANANRQARTHASNPYIVIVFKRSNNEMIEKARFRSCEMASEYASIYKDNPTIGAYIESHNF